MPLPYPSSFDEKETLPPRKAEEASPIPPVGPYEVEKQIARGGMGVIYKGRDTRDGSVVALKFIRTDRLGVSVEKLEKRLGREADILARLNHPHIVRFHDAGQVRGHPYLAMAFVEGTSLDRHLTRFALDLRAAAALMEKVARAVQHAHERGVIHRDLKPANVLVGEQDKPVLIDFGLAKVVAEEDELSAPGLLIGTAAYLPPEQTPGRTVRPGVTNDIWSLGVILYELTTGRQPFQGEDVWDCVLKIETTPPPRPSAVRPELDEALETIILRCLEKQPEQRYSSAAALADDLCRWLNPEPAAPIEPAASEAPRKPLAREVLLRLGIGIGAFLGLTVMLTAYPPRLTNPQSASPSASASTGAKEPLHALTEALARGEAISLLGNDYLPRWYRVRAGQTSLTGTDQLTLSSYSPSLVELMPELPGKRYRLRMEVRCQNIELGEVGIYFADSQDKVSGQPEHRFCALFMSQSLHTNRVGLGAFRYRASLPDRKEMFLRALFCEHRLPAVDNSPEEGLEGNWRRVSVDVSPERMTLFLNGVQLGEATAARQLRVWNSLMTREPPGSSKGLPLSGNGAFGLYINRSTASFRCVVVEPLPAGP